MKNTYTRTMFIESFEGCIFKLYITEGLRWECEEPDRVVRYENVVSYDIIKGGEEAAEIEAETDESGIDENHEYLVLHFANGEASTFRSSHVDLHIRG